MQKSTPVVGARRHKTPILAQKSGVIEYYGYRNYDAASGNATIGWFEKRVAFSGGGSPNL